MIKTLIPKFMPIKDVLPPTYQLMKLQVVRLLVKQSVMVNSHGLDLLFLLMTKSQLLHLLLVVQAEVLIQLIPSATVLTGK